MIEQTEKGQILMRNTYKIQMSKEGVPIYFSSMFDSGNMEKVEIGANNSIVVTPAHDCAGSGIQSHAKGWFYFSVKGAPLHTKLKIIIKKMTQLSSQVLHSIIKQSQNNPNTSNPSTDTNTSNGNVVNQQKQLKTKEDDTELHIEFEVLKLNQIFFAYTYPFSYEDNQKFLQKLAIEVKKNKTIFYDDEILVFSSEGRKVHVVTVTGNEEGSEKEQETIIDAFLFPLKVNKAIRKFTPQKKVIIISARVHPAEAPSSHTFNGLMKFLVSKDARAHLLRKNFVFKLIPMLNPDGVACGQYRMDLLGQNLNRFYQNPDPSLQPSAYGVKIMGQHYFQQKKLCFYLDLHAHPQRKGNFIYGNAFESFESQAQTHLFAKILSLNTVQFDYEYSSFDEKHMTLKDKNQNLTKQGCGRVVFQKEFNLPYSYTMQCGYTCSTSLNQIVGIDKGNRKFEKFGILPDEMQNLKSQYYANGRKNLLFTIKAYENLGKNIAVSILDLFSLNPASRLPNTQFKNVDNLRKELISILQYASNQTNFRKYLLKPFSQQSIKPNSQPSQGSVCGAKTINSIDSLGLKVQKALIDGQRQRKGVCLHPKQFLFSQTKKTLSVKQTRKAPRQEVNREKLRNPTLPKVNLFRLNNLLRKSDQSKLNKC